MNLHQHRAATFLAAVVTLTVIGLGAAPAATARQDAGPFVTQDTHPVCGLARVDRQLVACDNLTGNGVPAPTWVPED